MTQQILGPSGSPRRRWTVFVPLLVAFALGLMYVAGAQAVHDEGVFELDGNATENDGPLNPPNPEAILVGEDWDRVFAGTSSAGATAFVTDSTIKVPPTLAGAGDSILSTNTKDIQQIVDWDWKQTLQTSVQDKADIENAMAAQYVIDSGADDCGLSPPTDECELLYFGSDRFSNSGDTVMGFWFFRSEVTANPVDANGDGTFDGSHTARVDAPDPADPPLSRGDILIVADFRQGGKAPQIQIYEWVTSGGSASANLDLIGGGPNPASCTQAPPEKNNQPPVPPISGPDNFCATANQFVITSPWPYLAKDNSGGTTGDGGDDTKFGVATFMEGGINLTALGFGDTCFASFMAETRASHSVTSTLSDFALGTFGECTSGITTTPQSTVNGTDFTTVTTKSIGANARVAVRDHAEIAVTGADEFEGTVKFFLCGPLALDNAENCSTGGVQIGDADGEPVDGALGAATVNSAVATLTSVGDYCWRAEYSGDEDVGVPPSSDPADSVEDGGTQSECFQIDPVQPTLRPRCGACHARNPITDTASLTGTAKQPGTDGVGPGGTINATAATQADADGTITWSVSGPDDCDAAGLTVTGSPVDVDGDDASYGPVEATPTAIGVYTWVATVQRRSPNTLNAGGVRRSPDFDGNEEVTVTGVSATHDRAGLAAERHGNPHRCHRSNGT